MANHRPTRAQLIAGLKPILEIACEGLGLLECLLFSLQEKRACPSSAVLVEYLERLIWCNEELAILLEEPLQDLLPPESPLSIYLRARLPPPGERTERQTHAAGR